jgi:transcriptional regulator with XRE-family HTH domain
MGESSSMPVQQWLDRLGKRLAQYRLNRNLTQNELARIAGISRRTLARLENGESTQLENFLRTLVALQLEDGLERLVPEVPESPIQQLERSGRSRKRATGSRKSRPEPAEQWSWVDKT